MVDKQEFAFNCINDGEPFTLPEDTMGDWDAYIEAKLQFLRDNEDMLDGGGKAQVLMLAEREGNLAFLLHVLQRVDDNAGKTTIKDELTREQVNDLINHLLPAELAEGDEKNEKGD